MTVQAMPWSIQGQSHPAETARSAVAAIFGVPVAAHTIAASVTTAGGGHGVAGSTDLAVSQNGTPNMSVNVAAGRALIRAGHAGNITSGCYSFLNDATVNLIISAADATNPRYDLVIAEARDANYTGAAYDARLTVVTGTPAASPADPSLTSYPNCLVLARVRVEAAVTSIVTAKITDLRTRIYAAGGVAVVASAASLPTGASLYPGLRAFAIAEICEYLYDGTGWIIMSEPTQSYTPTVANLTVGNGALACTYHRSDGYCDLLFKFTLGSTSAVGTNPTFTVPSGLDIFGAGEVDVASVTLYDSSAVVRKHGTLKPNSTTVLGIQVTDTSAATAGDASITATVPFTWAVSDVIYAAVRYRMTTRYS